MQTSDGIGAIAAALSKFRKGVPLIPKTKTARIPGKGDKPGYSYKYADLADMMDVCTPLLADNGLAVVQSVSSDIQSVAIQTLIAHETGEWIMSDVFMLPAGATPQTAGSAATYGKRYQYAGMLDVSSDEDDDGAAATHSADAVSGPPAPRSASKASTSGGSAKGEGLASEAQLRKAYAMRKTLGLSDESYERQLQQHYGKATDNTLTKADVSDLFERLQSAIDAKATSEVDGTPFDEGYAPAPDDAPDIDF